MSKSIAEISSYNHLDDERLDNVRYFYSQELIFSLNSSKSLGVSLLLLSFYFKKVVCV